MKTEEDYDEEEKLEEKLIEAKCQSCDEITSHTVISDDDDDPTIIQCTVCDETREYHPKKSLKGKSASAKKAGLASKMVRKEKVGLSDFNKIMAKHDVSEAIPYEMTRAYKEAELINHQFFGVGYVRGTVYPNKIDVLFKEGCKLLICAPHEERTLSLETPAPQSQKGHSSHSRNPSAWKPWSSISEEKKDHDFAWDNEESAE